MAPLEVLVCCSERRSEVKKKLTCLLFALLGVMGALSVGVRSAEAGRCVTQCTEEGCCRRCCERGGSLICPDIFVCP